MKILMLFISLNLYAEDFKSRVQNEELLTPELENTCIETASNYGDGNGAVTFDENCWNLTLFKANNEAIVESADNEIFAFGYKNQIHLSYNDQVTLLPVTGVIAGNQTNLQEVHSIYLDETRRYLVAIVNSPKEIFYFRVQEGNIAPSKRIQTDYLINAKSLVLTPSKEAIQISYDGDPTINTISAFKDFFGTVTKEQVELVE